MLTPRLNWITGEGLTHLHKWEADWRRSLACGYMTVRVSSDGLLWATNELMHRTVDDTCWTFDIENKKQVDGLWGN